MAELLDFALVDPDNRRPLRRWRNEFGAEMYHGGSLLLVKLMVRFLVSLLVREEDTR